MKRKVVARCVFGLLLFWCAAVPVAFALVPVLFAEVAASVVESFAVRSVARSVVSTVGTAANDASWGNTFYSWMTAARAIGSVVLNTTAASGVPSVVEVQLAAPAEELSKAGVVDKYRVIFPEYIPASISADGLTHTLPSFLLRDLPYPAADDFVVWWNSYVRPGYYLNRVTIQNTDCWEEQWHLGRYACYLLGPTYNMDVELYVYKSEEKDGIGRVMRSGGYFSADESDPDWSAEDVSRIRNVPALRFSGVVAGNQAALDVVASSSGISLKYQEQSGTSVRSLDMVTDAAIVPMYYGNALGEGVLAVPSFFEEGGASGGSVSVEFPTDYARTGEAVQAVDAAQALQNQQLAESLDIPPMPSRTFNIDFTSVAFASSATCPADIQFSVFSQTFGISYRPMCDFAALLRPLFLLFGAITAAVVFIRGLS